MTQLQRESTYPGSGPEHEAFPSAEAGFSRAEAGFTIMEIMIATAILVVGLLGILALFPVAIDLGKRSIQDTNAVLLAKSVEQAIREGMTHRKGQSEDGKWTYFLFQHDGVLDPLPRRVADADPSKDYYILLPDLDSDTGSRAMSRGEAEASAKLFLFPEDDGLSWTQVIQGIEREFEDEGSGTPNGGGVPLAADNDLDDKTYDLGDGGSYSGYRVRRTYQVGAERLRDPDADVSDPLYQYSFAFTLRRCAHDASLGQHALTDNEVIPSGELFEAEILIFRTFIPDSDTYSTPIYQTKIFLHK